MKRLLWTVVLLVTVTLAGCLETKPRSFFAVDGIRVGSPRKEGGAYYLPLQFETVTIQSAQWLYAVKSEVKGTDIYITAVYSVPPGLQKSRYSGAVELGGLRPGTYSLRYRDPDGTIHDLQILKFE